MFSGQKPECEPRPGRPRERRRRFSNSFILPRFEPMNRCLGLIALLLAIALNVSAADYKPGFVESLITDQFQSPTSLALAPDGRIFISEKGGAIRIIENGILLSTPFVTIEVDVYGERGLSSIILDQDFDDNGYVYAYYNVKDGEHNRIVRFTANGNAAIPGSETVLMELGRLAGTIHNGGAMRWGTDGYLYIATGEGGAHDESQNLNSELGKILRISKTGSIPTDNPFYATTTGNARAIYALGFRNPFTFDIDPQSNRIFVNDVGNVEFEEVNEVRSGKNYGWPIVEGFLQNETPPANYQDPLVAYGHDVGCAVVGGAVYNPFQTDFPDDIKGHYLFTDYCTGTMSMLNLQTNQVTDTFATGFDRLTSMVVDQQSGMIYFCEFISGEVWRIEYLGTGAPFISRHPDDQLVPVGETATFTCSAIASDPIQYQWLRNGAIIPGAQQPELQLANTTLPDSGDVVQCRVYNQQGSQLSDPAYLEVTTNLRPICSISSPSATHLYEAGQVIQYAGTAHDPETGPVPLASKFWQVDFHHDEHVHPHVPATSGNDGGSFLIPYIGETDTNVWYRIHLIAVDDRGMEGRSFVDIHPSIGRFGLATQPPGLELYHDGAAVQTPAVYSGVPGMARVIVAPEMTVHHDSLFRFVKWNVPGTSTLEISIPGSFQEYIAEYEYLGEYIVGNGDGLLGEYWNNVSLSCRSTFSQVDPVIDFRIGDGLPEHVSDYSMAIFMGKDTLGTRWTGDLLAPVNATYTLELTFDDRIRFYLDGELLIDRFDHLSLGSETVKVDLQAGVRYPIQIDYAEVRGNSTAIFKWDTPWFPKAVVPQAHLYSTSLHPEVFTSNQPKLCLFPVPFGDVLNLTMQGAGADPLTVKVEIFDAMGKQVKNERLQIDAANPATVDVSNLVSGAVYLVRVSSKNGVASSRGVKL